MSVKTTIESIVNSMTPAHSFVYERPNKANVSADEVTFPAVIMIESTSGRLIDQRNQIQDSVVITMQFLDKVADIEDDAETNETIFDAEKTAMIQFVRRFNNNGTFVRTDSWQYEAIKERVYDVGVVGWSVTFEPILRVGTSNCV